MYYIHARLACVQSAFAHGPLQFLKILVQIRVRKNFKLFFVSQEKDPNFFFFSLKRFQNFSYFLLRRAWLHDTDATSPFTIDSEWSFHQTKGSRHKSWTNAKSYPLRSKKKMLWPFFPQRKLHISLQKKRCPKLYKGSWCILLLSIRGKSKPNAKTTGEYKDLMLVLLLMRVIFSFFTCYGTYLYLYVFFFWLNTVSPTAF